MLGLALLWWTAVHLPEQRQEVRHRADRATLRLALPATLHAPRGRGIAADARELSLKLVRVARQSRTWQWFTPGKALADTATGDVG